jgi:cellulose synthase/poly-beta-1,6-N-acetylglucosamine synthase-like glycosyltransferase
MVITAVVLALLVPATAACLGYLVPTLAGLFPGGKRPQVPPARLQRTSQPPAPTRAFTVLIPAHNEEHTLPAALRSLLVIDYPPELLRVCVVADNCTDGTAAAARGAGAECVERVDPANRGKGYAVAFGLEHVLRTRPDAVLILDADCELAPNALLEIESLFAAGAQAVQAAVRSRNADDGPAGFVAAVGAEFDDATAAGWDRLGFSVPLRGTGMAFHWTVLQRFGWDAFGLAEDAEYALRLKRAGVRVRYCGGAEVTCSAPPSVADLCRQRRRWSAAGVFASKPLVLAHLAVAVASGVACGLVYWSAVLVIVFAALYLRAVCAVGLTPQRIGSLLRAPGVVWRLGWVAVMGLGRRGGVWERTTRAGERAG